MFGEALGKLVGAGKKIVDDTEQIDSRFYAEVMDEISQGFKDKAAVGKAIAQSDGNEAKFDSLYVKIRAQALQEQFMIRQETLEIEEEHKESLERALCTNLINKHIKGHFHILFKDELKKNGFKVTFFSLNYTSCLRKDGHTYFSEIDCNNMDFIIKDSNGKIMHKFHIKESQLDM